MGRALLITQLEFQAVADAVWDFLALEDTTKR